LEVDILAVGTAAMYVIRCLLHEWVQACVEHYGRQARSTFLKSSVWPC